MAPNATTPVAISSISFNEKVDATPEGDLYLVENGITTDLEWNIKDKAYPVIYLNAYAIQVDQIADIDTAISYYGDQWNGLNGGKATVVDSAANLNDAITKGGSIVLATDVELDAGLVVPDGKNVVLNLNGKTLSAKSTEAKASNAINNKGELTILNGTITYEGVGDTTFGYGTNTINNTGKLVIDGATIINTTKSGSSVAIDCSAGADLTINSGVVKSEKNAIRLCPFSSAPIKCTINGGSVTGSRAIQIQLPSNKPAEAPEIDLTVNGGTLVSTSGLAVYSYSAGQSFGNVSVALNGGTYYGDVAFGGGNTTTQEKVTIGDACVFYGEVIRYLANDTTENLAESDGIYAVATDNNSLNDALTAAGNEEVVVSLPAGNFVVPNSASGKTMTLIGNGDTVVDITTVPTYAGLPGATITFENVVIKSDQQGAGYNRGFAHTNKITYNNCEINGTLGLNTDTDFNNCTFNISGNYYSLWTWGATNVNITGCTFNSDGKALLLYGGVNTKLTVNGCTFNDNGGLTDLKAAIEIGNDYDKSYELIVNNTVVNGYEINDTGINTGTTLWANKNSMPQNKLNVVVDGIDVY